MGSDGRILCATFVFSASLVSIDADPLNPALPFAFDIAIGVRPTDRELKARLDAELVRRRPEIARLLDSYGIPQRALPTYANEEQ